MTVEIGRSSFEAGAQRSVDLTGASGRPIFQWTEEPMTLFCGGFYLSHKVKGPNMARGGVNSLFKNLQTN